MLELLFIESFVVAPLVGAWIEIVNHCYVASCHKWSLPSWEIEIAVKLVFNRLENVAPLVGAWIEINDILVSL